MAPPALQASTDSTVLARGEHLARIGGCVGCHGEDLGGGTPESFGPIGVMSPPNLTAGRGGVGGNYTDGELARAIAQGIGDDGRTLRIMPSYEYNWWPQEDLAAIVSYVRSRPAVDREPPVTEIALMGRVLSQFGIMDLISAELIDHGAPPPDVPEPEPTARYGAFLVRGCVGCHGETLAGGPIPGAPADIPVPANLTPHETGLAAWTREDFEHLIDTRRRPDGRELDPFMPVAALQAMYPVEREAVWAYLRSLEPRETGDR